MLVAVAIVFFEIWFVRHIASTVLSLVVFNAVGGGAFLLLSKLTGPYEKDFSKWLAAVANAESTTKLLAWSGGVAVVLCLVTSSLTLQVPTDSFQATVTRGKAGDSFILAATAPAKHGVRRFYGRFRTEDVTIRLTEPRGREPLTVKFRPGGAINLQVPDSFPKKTYHLVRLVGISRVINPLPEESEAPRLRPYELWVQRGAAGAIRVSSDLRRGTFLAGSEVEDMRLVAKAEDAAARQAAFRSLAGTLEVSAEDEEEVQREWAALPYQFIGTEEYPVGTQLLFTVRQQDRVIARSTVTIGANHETSIQSAILGEP